jgi:hypothetical protein
MKGYRSLPTESGQRQAQMGTCQLYGLQDISISPSSRSDFDDPILTHPASLTRWHVLVLSESQLTCEVVTRCGSGGVASNVGALACRAQGSFGTLSAHPLLSTGWLRRNSPRNLVPFGIPQGYRLVASTLHFVCQLSPHLDTRPSTLCQLHRIATWPPGQTASPGSLVGERSRPRLPMDAPLS